jgi:hypothetical protein
VVEAGPNKTETTYENFGLLVFFGAGVGASWPPPEPLLVDPPLPEDEPPELELPELLEEPELLPPEEELEDSAALVAGGEGKGMNGSRVEPSLWKRTPPGVSETASFGFAGATVTGRAGAEPVTEMLGRLATDAGAELPESPVTAYATAAINATAAKATNGSRRREDRSERSDCRNSIMVSPSRRRA